MHHLRPVSQPCLTQTRQPMSGSLSSAAPKWTHVATFFQNGNMASVSEDELRSEISAIMKAADLSQLSAKKIRRRLEGKFDTDLTERKKEIDEMVMAEMKVIQEVKEEPKIKKEVKKEPEVKEEYEEDDDDESDFSPPEDCGPPKSKKKKLSKVDDDELEDDDFGSGRRRTRQVHTPKSKKSAKPVKKKRKKSEILVAMLRYSLLSDDLAELMGEKEMLKHEVVKRMWKIINERDLKDPENKQFIICDEQLLKIFGEERFKAFGMMKYLKDHMSPGSEKPRPVSEGDSDDDGSGPDEDTKKKSPTKRKSSGYSKPLLLSPALSNLMGEKQMPRSEVVKRMWMIIKERNLADPKNRQFMLCDSDLLPIFGLKRVRTFGMMKYLKDHMYNAEDLVGN